MSRMKKILFGVSVLFGVEFLCLAFFTYGNFSWTNQHIPPLLKAAQHVNIDAVKLDSPAKTDGRFVREMSDEPTPLRSAGFINANENAEFPLGSFIPVPHRFRTILAPKVSRYISKSVLNI